MMGSKTTWLFYLKDLKVKEEYRNLLPRPIGEDERAFEESIRVKSIEVPLIINQKNIILDGYRRYEKAKKFHLKQVPVYRMKFESELDEKEFIIGTNLHRRHLNDAQKAVTGLKLMEIEKEKGKKRQELTHLVRKGVQKREVMVDPELERPSEGGKSLEIAARKAGVRKSNLHKVQKIEKIARTDAGIADEWRQALEGKISIHRVYRSVKRKEAQDSLPKPDQIGPETLRKVMKNLILGDFRTIASKIPEKSIDLIFTDPLYYEKNLGLYEDVAILGKNKLKVGGSLICYAVPRYLPEIFEMMGKHLKYWSLIAIKNNGPSSRDRDRSLFSQMKYLLFYVKEKRRDRRCFNDFILSEHPEKTYHEWQQSVKEAEYCIKYLTRPSDRVLDPMMGTGTTGVAALKLGRTFLGIDVDEKMYEIALRRISLFVEKGLQEEDGLGKSETEDEEPSIILPEVPASHPEPVFLRDSMEMPA